MKPLDYVIIALVAAALFFAIRHTIRNRHRCCGDCSHCEQCEQCEQKKKRP